jgi:hypothetical protein
MRLGDFVKTFRSVVRTGSTTTANLFAEFFGGIWTAAACGNVITALVQAATVAIDASAGNEFVLPLTTNVAFILGNPTNTPPSGFDQIIQITIKNTSGGAHGAGTFDTLYKTSANVPAIADTKNRTLAFRWDGTNWVEIWRTAADVAN